MDKLTVRVGIPTALAVIPRTPRVLQRQGTVANAAAAATGTANTPGASGAVGTATGKANTAGAPGTGNRAGAAGTVDTARSATVMSNSLAGSMTGAASSAVKVRKFKEGNVVAAMEDDSKIFYGKCKCL
jgi:hypothetical protein